MHRRRSRRTLIAVLLVALVVTTGALFMRPASISYTAASGSVVTADGTYSCGPTTTGGFDCEPLPSQSGSPSAGPTPSASPSATPTPTPTTPAPTTPPPTTPPPSPTPTPTTPTPSPTGTPNGCLAKPSACGLPDATNTGVPAGTALTNHTGDVTLTSSISGWNLNGCIAIGASNVVIRDSVIHCAGAFPIRNDTRSAWTGTQIVNSRVDCAGTPGTALSGHNWAATGVDLSGCENGAAMDDNTSIVGSYIHDLVLVGAGHVDGVQAGGKNVTIQGDTIEQTTAGGTSAIITDPSTTANFTVAGNLLYNNGGSYVLYCPRTTSSNFVVTGNRFAWANAYGPSSSCVQPFVTWSGNVVDSTGAVLAAA